MKTKNLMFMFASIFALVLSLGLMSAIPEFKDTSGKNITITTLAYGNVNQGASTSESFRIYDSSPSDSLEKLAFNTPITFTDGAHTFQSTTSVTGAVPTLKDSTESGTMSLQVDVPSTQFAGTYTASLNLSGDEPTPTPFTPVSLTLTITVMDVTAPVITLYGNSATYIPKGTAYVDAGATALDETDGVLSPILSGTVNTNVEGVYTLTYTIKDLAQNTATKTRTVVVYSNFCPASSTSNNLEITKLKISNKGDGTDTSWYPSDTIEIEVKTTNLDLNNELEDVTIVLGVFKKGSNINVADEMIWISKDEEEFEFGDIEAGKNEEHTFKFKVNPSEFTFSSSQEFYIKVKVFSGTNCQSFSDAFNEGYFNIVSIKPQSNNNAVIVDVSSLPNAEAICGQKATFTADVWNIGKEDYEDKIKVMLKNSDLGINEEQVILGDLDSGEKTKVTFSFNIPMGAKEKTYNLEMSTSYDYDSDDNNYDETSEKTFKYPITLKECSAPEVQVTAALESGGEAGSELVIKTTITNTGTESAVFTFGLSDYNSWAEDVTFDTQILTLAPGQSQEVLITLNAKGDVSGEQTFSLKTYADGNLVSTQPLQVLITGKPQSLSSVAILVLVGLIVLTIIAIIIVAIVKSSNKE